MATIKIEVVAGAQTFTHTRTITAAHLVRFIDAYRTFSGSGTDEQVLTRWAQAIFDKARLLTRQMEMNTANQSAASGVTEIELTP